MLVRTLQDFCEIAFSSAGDSFPAPGIARSITKNPLQSSESLHAGLLHRNCTPPSIAAHKHPCISDLPRKREAVEDAGVISNPLQDRDVSVDAYRQAVVSHGRQLEGSARDLAHVVRLGAERSESRDLDEVIRHQLRQ